MSGRKAAGTGGRSKTATGQAIAMTNATSSVITRRGILGVFAATMVTAAPTYSNAFGILTGAGDIRRIRMYSGRTGESIDTIWSACASEMISGGSMRTILS